MHKPNLKSAIKNIGIKKLSGGGTYFAGSDIFEALQEIFDSYKKKRISIKELFAELHEIGFGFVLFFSGLIGAFVPLFGGFLPILFGIQMFKGADHPWLPKWLEEKEINIEEVRERFRRHKHRVKFLKSTLKHRMDIFSSVLGEKILGGIVVVCGVSIMIPLPATNLFPGIAIMIIALGYLTRDGLATIAGIIVGYLSSVFGFAVLVGVLYALASVF